MTWKALGFSSSEVLVFPFIRMLGHSGGTPTRRSEFGQVEEEFVLDDLQCRFEQTFLLSLFDKYVTYSAVGMRQACGTVPTTRTMTVEGARLPGSFARRREVGFQN